jgi:hypothetical protein
MLAASTMRAGRILLDLERCETGKLRRVAEKAKIPCPIYVPVGGHSTVSVRISRLAISINCVLSIRLNNPTAPTPKFASRKFPLAKPDDFVGWSRRTSFTSQVPN